MIAIEPQAYGSPFPELNDLVIYVHGTDKPTFSVVVDDVSGVAIKSTITGTNQTFMLKIDERGSVWDTRKDVNKRVAQSATSCPYI